MQRVASIKPRPYQGLTDEMLLDLLRRSDETAFEEIYLRHWLPLFRYAIVKLHRSDMAEDMCHDVFLSLWRRRSELAVNNLEGFLLQSVKYTIINHLKATLLDKRHMQQVANNIQMADDQADRAVLFDNLQQAWNKAIEALPEKSRKVFQLCKIRQLSNKEAAQQLNLSEKAIEYHITKSLKIIRLYLKELAPLLIFLLCSSLR